VLQVLVLLTFSARSCRGLDPGVTCRDVGLLTPYMCDCRSVFSLAHTGEAGGQHEEANVRNQAAGKPGTCRTSADVFSVLQNEALPSCGMPAVLLFSWKSDSALHPSPTPPFLQALLLARWEMARPHKIKQCRQQLGVATVARACLAQVGTALHVCRSSQLLHRTELKSSARMLLWPCSQQVTVGVKCAQHMPSAACWTYTWR
jgi:hypothetical protein